MTYVEEVFAGNREAHNAPDSEVEPGEMIIGTLQNQTAKDLYSMGQDIKNSANNLMEEIGAMGLRKKEELAEFKPRLVSLERQTSILIGLFWQYVYEEFPQATHPKVTVGIRKDWQVVIYKATPTFSFEDIFGRGFED